jgi:hypothetical protein
LGLFRGRPQQACAGAANFGSCYSCHQQHAATQTTFVQFYPTANPIAIKAGNFDAKE